MVKSEISRFYGSLCVDEATSPSVPVKKYRTEVGIVLSRIKQRFVRPTSSLISYFFTQNNVIRSIAL